MISFFARHPTAANLLMICLVAMGWLSMRKLRRETFPDFTPHEVQIRVPYPGAAAEEVEETICERVEDALDSVRFVREIRSEAREGLAVVTVEMDDAGDPVTFKDEIDTGVQSIDSFPLLVEDPIITELGTTDLVLALLVSGPMSPSDLKAYCVGLKDRLQVLPDVSLVRITGFSDHQLRIELSDEALKRYGLSATQIVEIVAGQSVNLPAGSIEVRDRDILIRFVEERKSVLELEDLVVVAVEGGAEVRLRDVGRVTDTFELDEDKVLLDGKRAGMLRVEKTKNQDVVGIANAVKQFIERERELHPNVSLIVTQDTSILVTDRLQMLVKNGVQGLLLVFVTMWLFFEVKLSFWVAMSLPVSFLGAFFFVPHLDLTINMLTMVGLLLALGLLMDDGVVIAENIATHLGQGESSTEAAVNGTNEVKNGVLSSFATTICILAPLAFLEGKLGRILEVIPMILILVLAVSLLEAFWILPAHLAHSLHGHDAKRSSRIRSKVTWFVDWAREQLLGRAVDLLLRWRYFAVGMALCVLLVSVAMLIGGVLKFQALPELDGDVIVARLLLPQGTSLSRTESTIQKIVSGLHRVNEKYQPQQPGQQDLVKMVYARFNENTDALEEGPHVATVYADLLSAETRDARLDDVLQDWREQVGTLPDVLGMVYTEPAIGPAGRSIEIRVQGTDLQTLKLAAADLHEWLSQFEGVSNLSDDLRPGKQELQIRMREGSSGLGLTAAGMAGQLRAAFHGMTASEIQVGPESYEVDIRLARTDQSSLGDLDRFRFLLPDGKLVPFSTVAEARPARGWARIARVDGMRTVTLRGDVDSRIANTANLISLLDQTYLPELKARYEGIAIAYEGEIRETAVTQSSMKRAMLIGVIGIFVLLSFQFRSYIEPIIVMFAIPFALVGVIWGHLIMGLDLSMPSIMGLLSLAGIVVNDSILLVLFLKIQRSQGKPLLESAAQASRQRFRAIMITSLTTIAGLLPLLFERSLQAQIIIPLAISIAFGLMASTVLVLLIVPCLYVILADFRLID